MKSLKEEGESKGVWWEWVKIGLVSCTACAGVTTATKKGKGDIKKKGGGEKKS